MAAGRLEARGEQRRRARERWPARGVARRRRDRGPHAENCLITSMCRPGARRAHGPRASVQSACAVATAAAVARRSPGVQLRRSTELYPTSLKPASSTRKKTTCGAAAAPRAGAGVGAAEPRDADDGEGLARTRRRRRVGEPPARRRRASRAAAWRPPSRERVVEHDDERGTRPRRCEHPPPAARPRTAPRRPYSRFLPSSASTSMTSSMVLQEDHTSSIAMAQDAHAGPRHFSIPRPAARWRASVPRKRPCRAGRRGFSSPEAGAGLPDVRPSTRAGGGRGLARVAALARVGEPDAGTALRGSTATPTTRRAARRRRGSRRRRSRASRRRRTRRSSS